MAQQEKPITIKYYDTFWYEMGEYDEENNTIYINSKLQKKQKLKRFVIRHELMHHYKNKHLWLDIKDITKLLFMKDTWKYLKEYVEAI